MRPGRAALLTAPAMLLVVAGTGCGGTQVSQKDLESKVAQFLEGQTGMGAQVQCPKHLTGTKGERFTCTTALAGRTTDLDFEFSQKGKFRLVQTRLQ